MMDPISIGTAAAKALSGASENSFAKALLLPTAQAYGDHWGEQARERLRAKADAKRNENAQVHISAITERIRGKFDPDPTLAAEWLEGVEKVDPIDADLSRVWGATLLAIGQQSAARAELLKAAQSMTALEAESFQRMNKSWLAGLADYEMHGRLERLGLLLTPADFLLRSPIGIASFWLLGMILNIALLFSSGYFGVSDYKLIAFTGFLIVFLVITLLGVAIPKRTKLGDALARFIREYDQAGNAVSSDHPEK